MRARIFWAARRMQAALRLVDGWPDWPGRIVVLVGPEGSGKSHLAAIWAEHSGARFLAARSLAGSDPPAALATGALVVEDLATGRFDETALFHLLNLAREEAAYVLLTARSAACRMDASHCGSGLAAQGVAGGRARAAGRCAAARGAGEAVRRSPARRRGKPDRLRRHAHRAFLCGGAGGGGAARCRGDAPETAVDPGAGGRGAARPETRPERLDPGPRACALCHWSRHEGRP